MRTIKGRDVLVDAISDEMEDERTHWLEADIILFQAYEITQ